MGGEQVTSMEICEAKARNNALWVQRWAIGVLALSAAFPVVSAMGFASNDSLHFFLKRIPAALWGAWAVLSIAQVLFGSELLRLYMPSAAQDWILANCIVALGNLLA